MTATARTTKTAQVGAAGGTRPRRTAAAPGLLVLSVTSSFSEVWPALAAELELPLVQVTEPGDFDQLGDVIGVVVAAGDEGRLEPLLLETVAGGMAIACVGSVADHRLAAAVVRAGADEYFALPADYDLLRSWVADRAERLRQQAAGRSFADGEVSKYRFDGILGESPALRAALSRAARVIPHAGVTVLLTGETGTGKELLARAIHYNGPRRDAPFVDLNCAAIPENLLESELFGHEKGAFTDAGAAKPGLMELANGGTLFLDEIGHLALPLQGKLLRALQERSIRRVGGTRNLPVDVRIIAATHVDLKAAVGRREFREDLYYRLNVVPVELPPLRARREDVVPLARHFLAQYAAEYGVSDPSLTAAAERALVERAWPGNIRELRNAVERAVLLASSAALDAADFALDDPRATAAGSDAQEGIPFPATLDEIARRAAQAMVALCGGNKSDAARRLGVSRPRLQRLLDAAASPDAFDALTPDDESHDA